MMVRVGWLRSSMTAWIIFLITVWCLAAIVLLGWFLVANMCNALLSCFVEEKVIIIVVIIGRRVHSCRHNIIVILLITAAPCQPLFQCLFGISSMCKTTSLCWLWLEHNINQATFGRSSGDCAGKFK